MDQLCFNAGESVIAIVTAVVSGASLIANWVPAPDKLEGKFAKAISKIVHYVALDVVTGKKK